MAIDVNKIADELAGQGSVHPLTGYESALGVFTKVTRGVSWNGQVGKMGSTGSSYMGEGKPGAFLKNLCKKSWRTAPPEHKPAKNTDRVVNRTLLFTRIPI